MILRIDALHNIRERNFFLAQCRFQYNAFVLIRYYKTLYIISVKHIIKTGGIKHL